MPRFFVDDVSGDKIFIKGEDAKHISKSLRMKIGEEVIVCDKNEIEHFCTISNIDDVVTLDISKSAPCENEPSVEVVLYQAMPKSDKMDFIIQKAVELGITRIVPILTERCISRPDAKSMKKKIERFQKISESAAKQSGRGVIPKIDNLLSYNGACDQALKSDCAMLFYELGGERVENIIGNSAKSISFIIGSEGGFSETEVETAQQKGIKTASLGRRILRCETAPIVAASIIMFVTKNI